MTALSASRLTPQMNAPHPANSYQNVPLAVALVYGGGLVGINFSGYLERAAVGSNKVLKIIGIADADVDNTGGLAGDKSAKVLRGIFKLANGAGVDALSQADVGRICYALDDATVVRTPAFGARPAAGRVVQVDSDGVFVDTTQTTDSEQDVELVLAAGADLSAKQFYIVTQNAANQVVLGGAGTEVLGVLQNAPANAAIAIVKVLGKTRCIAGVAIAQGVIFASDAAGKAKTAARLVQATGAASYGLGRALTATAADLDPFEALLTHSGVRGTSDA